MRLFILACFLALASTAAAQPPNEFPSVRLSGDQLRATWSKRKEPAFVLNAPKDGRPFVHPIRPWDGGGVFTEVSPGHHKHQTGLFIGFVKANGRDYFHNRGKDHHRRDKDPLLDFGQSPFKAVHELLDGAGKALATQEQTWLLMEWPDGYIADLELSLEAKAALTLGKHDYGGLFLRMPWRPKTGGKAVNSEGDENAKAEGRKARWVDVGMPIEGRKDWGRIAILDHKDNPRHPPTWRVDGQLGVGPALTRAADLKIEAGKKLTLKYRLIVYTGDHNAKWVEATWKDFTRK